MFIFGKNNLQNYFHRVVNNTMATLKDNDSFTKSVIDTHAIFQNDKAQGIIFYVDGENITFTEVKIPETKSVQPAVPKEAFVKYSGRAAEGVRVNSGERSSSEFVDPASLVGDATKDETKDVPQDLDDNEVDASDMPYYKHFDKFYTYIDGYDKPGYYYDQDGLRYTKSNDGTDKYISVLKDMSKKPKAMLVYTKTENGQFTLTNKKTDERKLRAVLILKFSDEINKIRNPKFKELQSQPDVANPQLSEKTKSRTKIDSHTDSLFTKRNVKKPTNNDNKNIRPKSSSKTQSVQSAKYPRNESNPTSDIVGQDSNIHSFSRGTQSNAINVARNDHKSPRLSSSQLNLRNKRVNPKLSPIPLNPPPTSQEEVREELEKNKNRGKYFVTTGNPIELNIGTNDTGKPFDQLLTSTDIHIEIDLGKYINNPDTQSYIAQFVQANQQFFINTKYDSDKWHFYKTANSRTTEKPAVGFKHLATNTEYSLLITDVNINTDELFTNGTEIYDLQLELGKDEKSILININSPTEYIMQFSKLKPYHLKQPDVKNTFTFENKEESVNQKKTGVAFGRSV